MADLSSLVRQWVQKAEEDWEAAQLLATHDSQATTTCFHCQQYVEKLLKASLLAIGAEVPKTHDLRTLSALLTNRDRAWFWDEEDLDDLTSAAVAMRYPGYPIDSSDANESITCARALRQALLVRLGYKLEA